MAEARKACEILKARPLHAGQLNGQAIVDAAHSESFRKIIEAEHPDILFTHWPIDNHADHRAISMLAYDAWLKMGKRFAFYYYEVSNGEDTVQFSPTHHVDISATEPRKRQACYAHASQTPRQVLRAPGAGHPDARNRERPSSRRRLHPARPEPGFRPADGVIRAASWRSPGDSGEL